MFLKEFLWYYFVPKKTTLKRSPSISLKPSPVSNIGWKVTGRDITKMRLLNSG
jgi:hypothetical protein